MAVTERPEYMCLNCNDILELADEQVEEVRERARDFGGDDRAVRSSVNAISECCEKPAYVPLGEGVKVHA